MRKSLTQHGGSTFRCDACQAGPIYVQGLLAPEGWSTLQGFTETKGETLHACSPDCSHSLKTLYKRHK